MNAEPYGPQGARPVKLLVQLDRTSGRYRLTPEDEDSRWAVTATNHREVHEQLRPSFV